MTRRLLLPAAACTLMILSAGCARAPAFNVLGSFFPGWIACILVGVLLTVIVRFVLVKWNFEAKMQALPLVYLSLALFFACTLWLLFFE